MDHPLLNDNPNAIVLASHNWNPGNTAGTYNDRPFGVWYSGGQSQWAVFNQDFAPKPAGTDFNVLIPSPGDDTFVHSATAGNTSGQLTYIDQPSLNGNPEAAVLVTQNWNPSGTSGTYNNHPIGVYYINATGRWAIFNQDLANMTLGAAFNVTMRQPDQRTFVHTADAGSITSNWTSLDNYLSNENPYALVFATHNWDPNDVGVYNEHEIGVWYDFGNQWAVFNQDEAAIPDGASFNIFIIGYKGLLPMVLR
jgi:hypothetical protein